MRRTGLEYAIDRLRADSSYEMRGWDGLRCACGGIFKKPYAEHSPQRCKELRLGEVSGPNPRLC